TAGSNGSGSGTVQYAVSVNTAGGSRSGTLSIAGQTFTLTQSGAGCEYSISPTTQSFTSASGTGTVSVPAPPGCGLSAEINDGWATITAGSNGRGSGTVPSAVAVNPAGGSRS